MREYVNRSTGEKTSDRKVAMQWYRDGAQIECWHNGRLAITLLM